MKLISALLLSSTMLLGCSSAFKKEEYSNCKINGKESVTLNKGHQYRVYTNCGTFKVEDDLLTGRFDSADLYGSIEVGKHYDLQAAGPRNGFLGMFPNILRISSL